MLMKRNPNNCALFISIYIVVVTLISGCVKWAREVNPVKNADILWEVCVGGLAFGTIADGLHINET